MHSKSDANAFQAIMLVREETDSVMRHCHPWLYYCTSPVSDYSLQCILSLGFRIRLCASAIVFLIRPLLWSIKWYTFFICKRENWAKKMTNYSILQFLACGYNPAFDDSHVSGFGMCSGESKMLTPSVITSRAAEASCERCCNFWVIKRRVFV